MNIFAIQGEDRVYNFSEFKGLQLEYLKPYQELSQNISHVIVPEKRPF